MLEPTRWKADIFGVLERIGDEDYQRLAWFNRHSEVSSPDELINQLFDDYLFDDFIESRENNLSTIAQSAAHAFSISVNAFCDQTPQTLNPYETIDDPRWSQIRQEARSLLRLLMSE